MVAVVRVLKMESSWGRARKQKSMVSIIYYAGMFKTTIPGYQPHYMHVNLHQGTSKWVIIGAPEIATL